MVARVLLCLTFLSVAVLLCVYMYSPYQHIIIIPDDDKMIKYILLWNEPTSAPSMFLGRGFNAFTSNKCEYINCYVTDNMDALRSVGDFDAIVFNGRNLRLQTWPEHRTAEQKYVYANMESSHNYPVCNSRFDGFFNWTWTYKLDSDSRWGYFTVYNSSRHIVAPKINVDWPEMKPVGRETAVALASKNQAAAWFVSNCKTVSHREEFAKAVAKELSRYDLSLHVYGKCGSYVCPRKDESECNEMLKRSYYFYFAFENSLSEDYVTEKILTALQHFTVPVVFGGANYSRFLPPGSYLDARALGPRRLAKRMAAIIQNHRHDDGRLYHDFFRWRNHYTFKLTAENEDVCNICRLLNDPVSVSKVSSYRHFKQWWNTDGSGCPGETQRRENIKNVDKQILLGYVDWFGNR